LVQIVKVGFRDGDAVALMGSFYETLDDFTLLLEGAHTWNMKLAQDDSNYHDESLVGSGYEQN